MKAYFKKILGLSEKGASDLVWANLSATVVNFLLMATSGVIYCFMMDSLQPSLEGSTPSYQLMFYLLYIAIILLLIMISYYFAYNTRLDEATSSLDIQSESAVQTAINRLTKGKTVIVIAHRMRTIAGANQIIHLKEGKVSEFGTHNSLLVGNGDYAHMIDLQNKSLAWKIL